MDPWSTFYEISVEHMILKPKFFILHPDHQPYPFKEFFSFRSYVHIDTYHRMYSGHRQDIEQAANLSTNYRH